MSALTAPSSTLYELEGDLLFLLDTAEGGIDPQQQAEFDTELTEAIAKTIEKRDRCGSFIRHCETMASNCEEEIKRLRSRKQNFERAAERMRGYLSFVIESLGHDAKGKRKKLEGNLFSFSLRSNPPSVQIEDQDKLPSQYKTATITLSVSQWNEIIHACKCSPFEDTAEPLELQMMAAERGIDRKAVKRDLEAGLEVPGADLTLGSTSLVVR